MQDMNFDLDDEDLDDIDTQVCSCLPLISYSYYMLVIQTVLGIAMTLCFCPIQGIDLDDDDEDLLQDD